MKTKQTIALISLCGLFVCTDAQAQSLYFGLGAGYGFPAAKQTISDQTSTNSGTLNTNQYTTKNLSLGKGVNVGLLVGYMFNKNVGAELGISYLIGGKTESNYNFIGSFNSSKSTDSYSGSTLRLIPTLRMTVGESKLRPYMKMGLIIGLGSKLMYENNSSYTDSSGTSTGEQVTEYTGGMSLGLHGGLGISYALSDKMCLFGEIAGYYQNWAPKKSEITTYTQDGVDKLPNINTINKETEYLDDYSISNAPSTNVNSPAKQQKFFLPFSSIGINIGIIFTLGGESAAN